MSFLKDSLIPVLFCFTISLSTYAQNAKDNLDKYWNYRDRLTNYFVKVGPDIGESVVAHIRNKNKEHKKGFSISDQTIDLAWYIGILATEYALLEQNFQSTEESKRELHYAIMAFDRLDRCETYPPWNMDNDTLDGFFQRHDIELEIHPEKFSIVGRNKGLSPQDTWGTKPLGVPTYISGYDEENGRPNYYSASLSQDQVVHIIMGFALIYKCLPDTELTFLDNESQKQTINFNKKAQEVIDRLLRYFHKNNHWIIKDPFGDNVKRGHNAIMFAYPLATIGNRITGLSYDDVWSQSFWAKKLWGLNRVPNWVNDYNSTMSLTLAALSDTWWDVTPFGKLNSTGYYINLCGSPWNRETFFLLLYRFVNNKKTKYYDLGKILSQINSAPHSGPYYWAQDSLELECCGIQAGKPDSGWAYTNKFRGTKKEQEGLDDNPYIGNFSGIDYMLLYNLYHLIENPTPYKKE